MDLGGHSLIAARFISVVRQTPALAGITLQDVYQHRTLRKLGAMLDGRMGAQSGEKKTSVCAATLRPALWCGVAQSLALPFILSISTAQWLGVFITYMIFLQGTDYTFGWMALCCRLPMSPSNLARCFSLLP